MLQIYKDNRTDKKSKTEQPKNRIQFLKTRFF